jgi:hypothetical protein
MKLIDLINEDARSFNKEDPKEEKRVKTIFKALRKGVIEVQHPRTDEIIKFRYYINDPVLYRWKFYRKGEIIFTIITSNLTEEGITIYCDDEYVVDKCMPYTESIEKNPTGIHLREMFMNKLKNRFDAFDVKLHINNYSMKFVLDEPKEETLNEQLTDNDIKKCKLIWKLYNSGIITDDNKKYKYILKDDYIITPSQESRIPMISVRGNMYTLLRIYRMEDNGHMVLLNYELDNTIRSYIVVKIKKRFAQHNILLSI